MITESPYGPPSQRFPTPYDHPEAMGMPVPAAPTEQVPGPTTQGSFAFELPIHSSGVYESFRSGLGLVIGCLGSIPLVPCPNPFKSVDQGYVGLVTRFGRFYKATDPGLVMINRLTERLQCIEMRIRVQPIESVTIMTKDNVNISIDSVLYWHIVDPYKAIYGVVDVGRALNERTQTTLRNILGTHVLQDIIENREAMASSISSMIDEPAHAWGVKVESILIKDLIFSNELKDSLSSAAQQKRIGESKVIAAQAEVDASKLMREAADILNSPAAIQLRYLETMQAMSKTSNSKVIFMPMSVPNTAESALASTALQTQLSEM